MALKPSKKPKKRRADKTSKAYVFEIQVNVCGIQILILIVLPGLVCLS